MNINLLKYIEKFRHFYFVSPHFDDAVLSAGDLISFLAGKKDVTIINIFTKAGKGNTLSAKKFLSYCGYKDADKLFIDRDKEDQKVFSVLKVKRINLNITDALWRKRSTNKIMKILDGVLPEVNSMYPTHRFHIGKGKIAKGDEILINNISGKLKKITKTDRSVVFCPLGIGNHVDHLIARKACENSFSDVFYWTDFPYFIREDSDSKSGKVSDLNEYSFMNNIAGKTELIKMYKSQFNLLFPDKKVPLQDEKYYTKKSRMNYLK